MKSAQLSFLEDLITDVAKEEPLNPVDFCIDWLKTYQQSHRPTEDSGSSEEEEELDEEEERKIQERIRSRQERKCSRQGVSSEVFGEYNRR